MVSVKSYIILFYFLPEIPPLRITKNKNIQTNALILAICELN